MLAKGLTPGQPLTNEALEVNHYVYQVIEVENNHKKLAPLSAVGLLRPTSFIRYSFKMLTGDLLAH